MRPFAQVLSIVWGLLLVTLILVVVGASAALGGKATQPARRGSAPRLGATSTPGPRLTPNAAMQATTYYLVSSPEQAMFVSELHEHALQAVAQRTPWVIMPEAVTLPAATAEETIAARDVIDGAYADYFEGKGAWVSVVDTRDWCKPSASLQSRTYVPKELADAFVARCP